MPELENESAVLRSSRQVHDKDLPLNSIPLSSGQRALWFLQQLAPESTAYNVSRAVRLIGNTNVGVFHDTLQAVVARHPSLRAAFPSINGEPVCRILPHRQASFASEDASTWTETQIQDRLLRELHRPFDLANDPLVRALFLHRSEVENIFFLSIHHIVTDLWSMALLLDDMGTLYPELVIGSQFTLPPPTARYSDWVCSQKEMLESPVGGALQDFWLKQLGGDLPVLQLPTDRPRPPIQTYNGASRSAIVPSDLLCALKQMAKREKTTLFVVVLAAFKVLLARYSGQEDILIGTPKSGRKLRFSKVFGYFVNPVVIRTRPAGTLPFVKFLRAARETVADAFAHDAYPFPLLVEKLQPARDPSRSPVFQVMCAWQKTVSVRQVQNLAPFVMNESGGRIQFKEIDVQSMASRQLISLFDLSLLVAECDQSLSTVIEHNTDLFEEATIARMQDNFAVLLRSIVADPEQRLCDLALLAPGENTIVLQTDQQKPDELPPARIVKLFEQQVEATPLGVALIHDGRMVTYRDLNRAANKIAHELQLRNIGPQQLVGVYLDRSIDSIVVLLAILKSGGAYLPLDIELPQERIQFILNDAHARIVIGRSGVPLAIDRTGIDYVIIDDTLCTDGQEDDNNPQIEIHPEALAYVIYTSGSTGVPKGVLVSHGSLARHCKTIVPHYNLQATDRVLQFASLCFDASLEQVLPPLIAGSTVVLRGAALWSPEEFCRALVEHNVTVANVPPAYWHQVVQKCVLEPEIVAGNTIRLLIIGGDVFQPESVRLWNESPFRSARLLNAYGPTETTITASTCEVAELFETARLQRRVPIGTPLRHRKMYVLDRYLNPVPLGATGELYIGGDGVAQGYLGSPGLTADRFLPDPFAANGGARLYRTGDLVRRREDGNLEFVERTDHQVKIRGFRVELEEIEAVLSTHPHVRDVAAAISQEIADDKRIVAYVVSRANTRFHAEDLKAYLLSKLPSFMVPSAFVPLDALPLSPSGKVNRDALPKPTADALHLGKQYSPPRSPIEQELTNIWASLLGVERVGINDNFFDLGGHSLLATQVVSRVRQTYGLDIPLQRMFETPTVAELAHAIVRSIAETGSDEDLTQAFAEIEDLSPEELQRLLSNTSSEEGAV